MTLTYAIADLHGRWDLLKEAYSKIQFHAKEPGTVVHLGDYVDRGPHSRQIIEGLGKRLMWNGWKRIILKGNHEDIMVQCCRDPGKMSWWLGNGGGATLVSYGQCYGDIPNAEVVPKDHLDWIESLPLFYRDQHRVYVHAGVDRFTPLDQQDQQTLTWKLYDDRDERGHDNLHVVHGHHQHAHGPILQAGRTNLDTFAWYTGRLVIGVFDDDQPGGPVDKIEIQLAPAHSARALA